MNVCGAGMPLVIRNDAVFRLWMQSSIVSSDEIAIQIPACSKASFDLASGRESSCRLGIISPILDFDKMELGTRRYL